MESHVDHNGIRACRLQMATLFAIFILQLMLQSTAVPVLDTYSSASWVKGTSSAHTLQYLESKMEQLKTWLIALAASVNQVTIYRQVYFNQYDLYNLQ